MLDDALSWYNLKFADFSILAGFVNVLTDWYLLIIPIPAVMHLQISRSKKIGLLAMFVTGGVCV